ncbi:MAG: GspH/FimT family pseudopilin [Sphaerotilus natans]
MNLHALRTREAGRPPARAAGFGAVELMVTVAILATISAFGLPALADFVARQRLAAVSGDFVGALALARSEAIRTGLQTLLLPLPGAGATGNEYGGGWQVVIDANASGTAEASETVVRSFPALSSTMRLGGDAPVAFAASGFLSRTVTLTMTLCPGAGRRQGYAVSVLPTGVADVVRVTSCS